MSFHSPFPDVVIPDTSVYDYLFADMADEDDDLVALIDTKTRAGLSYGGLDGLRRREQAQWAQRNVLEPHGRFRAPIGGSADAYGLDRTLRPPT